MKNLHRIALVATLSIITLSSATAAQSITVFDDVGYGGRSQTFRSAVSNLQADSWNDRISSLTISGTWEVCRDADYRNCEIFERDISDLRSYRMNDEISSLRPARGQGITVFDDIRYGGGNQTFTGAVPNLDRMSWNDRISSFQLSGAWEVCRDADYRNCQEFERDIDDLRSFGLNDQISSMRPAGETGSGGRPGGGRPDGPASYNRESSEFAAKQVYRALLGRDADDEGLRQGAQQILEGRLDSWVRSMAASREFQQRSAGVDADQLLDQIYQGLLGRGVDTSGRDGYLRQIERRQAADVVLDIMESAEFRDRLPRRRPGRR